MVAEIKNYDWKLTGRQDQAFEALARPEVKRLLYGGAKGGGKSHFLCHWAMYWCLFIIQFCKINGVPEFPFPVGFMGRKQGIDFKDTTLVTWKNTIPQELYRIVGQPAKIIVMDRVQIDTGGLDRTESINKFNSAEYMFYCIDQAEEVEKDDVSVLHGSLRKKINGLHVPYKGLFTANPKECWLKKDFIYGDDPSDVYVPALPTDNPNLPDDYIETLTKAFKHRPELLKGYLEGDWNCFAGHDQVIKNLWVEACRGFTFHQVDRIYLTCDPAAFGDDETVIYLMNNTRVIKEKIYGQQETMYTANVLFVMSKENGNCPIVIDPLGVGEGIASRLREMGAEVIEVRNSVQASDPGLYYNLRAEVWDTVAEMFQLGQVEYNSEDTELASQLCTPTYDFRNGRKLVEAKAEIKKRIKRSPDRADAYVNGLYAYQQGWIPESHQRKLEHGMILTGPAADPMCL